MLKKRILYFGSFALTLLCTFYVMQLKTYAATDHYKKVDKSYVLEKVDGYNSYHEAYSICDSSTGELINMDDYPKREYLSFNDFFTRKILKNKRPFSKKQNDLISSYHLVKLILIDYQVRLNEWMNH